MVQDQNKVIKIIEIRRTKFIGYDILYLFFKFHRGDNIKRGKGQVSIINIMKKKLAFHHS